jgi:hypothetical protein
MVLTGNPNKHEDFLKVICTNNKSYSVLLYYSFSFSFDLVDTNLITSSTTVALVNRSSFIE